MSTVFFLRLPLYPSGCICALHLFRQVYAIIIILIARERVGEPLVERVKDAGANIGWLGWKAVELVQGVRLWINSGPTAQRAARMHGIYDARNVEDVIEARRDT